MKVTKKVISINSDSKMKLDNEATSKESAQCAINYIKSAIETLGDLSESEEVAKDSIANLAVVAMDLTSLCNK